MFGLTLWIYHDRLSVTISIIVCFIATLAHSENIIFHTNRPISINCSNGENIFISDIDVHDTETKCTHQSCNKTRIETIIRDTCQGEQSCTLSTGMSDGCLEEYGYVDLYYSCNGVIFLCHFEDLKCTFHSTRPHTSYQWKRVKGQRSPKGPNKDHTTLTDYGYFAFADAANGTFGDSTDMRSKWIIPHRNQCLSFWYYMHRNRNQTLKVYQIDYKTQIRPERVLWNTSNSGANKWHHIILRLRRRTLKFRVVFRSIHGYGVEGHIALDDILVTNTKCNEVVIHQHTCLSLSKPIGQLKCSIDNINFQTYHATFVPQYGGCSKTYQSVRDAIEECKTSNASLCSFRVNAALHKKPECFMLNRLKVEYTCSEITSTIASQQVELNTSYFHAITSGLDFNTKENYNSTNLSAVTNVPDFNPEEYNSTVSLEEDKLAFGTGGFIGMAVLVLCLVVVIMVIVYRNRYRQKKRDSLLAKSNIRMNDYSDELDGTLRADVDNRISTIQPNVFHNLTYTNVGMDGSYSEGKIQINDDRIQNSVVEAGIKKQKKNISTNEIKQLKLGQKYEILDPVETGYDRSESIPEYELASKISRYEAYDDDEDGSDQYVLSKEGTYDTSSNIRHVPENDVNVYNQTVDDVYDTGCHERKLVKDETYDTSTNIHHMTENDGNVYNQTVDDVYNTGYHVRKMFKDDTYDHFSA